VNEKQQYIYENPNINYHNNISVPETTMIDEVEYMKNYKDTNYDNQNIDNENPKKHHDTKSISSKASNTSVFNIPSITNGTRYLG